MQRWFGVGLRNMDMRIKQSGQQCTTSPVNDFFLRNRWLRFIDVADIPVLYQHMAMFKDSFTVKDANVTNQQGARRHLEACIHMSNPPLSDGETHARYDCS